MAWADGDYLSPTNLNYKSRGSEINPRDATFGADPSGADDSASSIQSALNVLSANGGGDLILDGTYLSASIITAGPYTRIRGVGRGSIHFSGATSGLNASSGSVHIQGVRLTGSATTVTTNVIGLTLTDNCTVRDSEFSGWNINVQSQGSNCLVDGNIMHESLGSQSGQGYGVLGLSPECRVVNNVFKQTGRHGVYFSGSATAGGATRSVAIGNIIELSDVAGGGSGLKAYATASQQTLRGIVFDGNTIRHTNPATVGLGIEFIDNVADSVAVGNTIIDADSRSMQIVADGSAASNLPRNCIFNGNVCSTQSGFFIFVGASGGNIPSGNLFSNNVTPRNSTSAISDSGNSTHIIGNAPYPDVLPTVTISSGQATPSVYNSRLLVSGNGSVTTVTYFANGFPGQQVLFRIADANTRFESGASLRLKDDADISAVSGDIYGFLKAGTVWYEVSRNTGG